MNRVNSFQEKIDGSSIFAIDKIWENPDPTSQVSANAHFEFNASKYDLFIVLVNQWATNVSTREFYEILKKGKEFLVTTTFTSGSNVQSLRRYIRINDDGLYCGQGTLHTQGSANGNNNASIIPKEVYGIKLPINDLSQYNG